MSSQFRSSPMNPGVPSGSVPGCEAPSSEDAWNVLGRAEAELNTPVGVEGQREDVIHENLAARAREREPVPVRVKARVEAKFAGGTAERRAVVDRFGQCAAGVRGSPSR